MANDASRCQFVSLFLLLATCCPSSARASMVHTYYNMTNRFLDVIQPSARFSEIVERFKSTGTLDQLSPLIQSTMQDYIGITACVVLGLILALAMFVGCLCFGPCRLCGCCGAGIKREPQRSSDKTKRITLTLIVLLLIILIAGGVAGTFLAGKELTGLFRPTSGSSDNTPRFVDSFFDQLAHLRTFLNGVHRALDYLESDSHVQNILQSLQGLLNDRLRTNLNSTLSATSTLIAALTSSLSSANVTIMEIQSTATSLTNQQSELNAKLTNISGNARVDIDGCATLNCSLLNISLANLRTDPYSFPPVDSALRTVQETHQTLSDIDLNVQIPDTALQSFSDKLKNSSILASLKEGLDIVFNALDFDQTEILKPYQSFINSVSYYAGDLGSHLFALFSSLYVIILAFFVVGLVIGVTAKPRTRAKAEWMFVAGSGSTCLISGFVMVLVFVLFFAGAIVYVEICRGIIYDDSEGNIFKLVLDPFLNSTLSSSSHRLPLDYSSVSVYDVVFVKCKKNEGTLNVLLDLFDLQQLLSKIPDLNLDFLNNTVASIIPAAAFQQLHDVTNSTATSVDFGSFNTLLNKPVLDVNLMTIADQMDAAANDLNGSAFVDLTNQAQRLRTVQNDDVAAISSSLGALNSTLLQLEALFATNGPVVEKTDNLRQLQLQLLSEAASFSQSITPQITELLQQQFRTLSNITSCGSLYNAVYGTFHLVCWDIFNPLNALWFTFGWTVTLLIPNIIFALWVGGLYARKPAESVQYTS